MPLAIVEHSETTRGRGRAADDMDDDVNAAESRENGIGHGRAAFSGGDIRRHKQLLRRKIVGTRTRGGHDHRACFAEPRCNRSTDALGAARDKSAAPIQFKRIANSVVPVGFHSPSPLTMLKAMCRCTVAMARTNKKVGYSPTGKLDDVTPDMAASGVEAAFRMLEGRWKMVIIFHLFDQSVLRFSELERAIPGISQKMLIQQLRELERDGIVQRTIYPQVPPKVEYRLTDWGQAMCPALDALLEWAAARPSAAIPD